MPTPTHAENKSLSRPDEDMVETITRVWNHVPAALLPDDPDEDEVASATIEDYAPYKWSPFQDYAHVVNSILSMSSYERRPRAHRVRGR